MPEAQMPVEGWLLLALAVIPGLALALAFRIRSRGED